MSTVLITSVGGLGQREVVQHLRTLPEVTRIVGTDTRRVCVPELDTFHRVRPGGEYGYTIDMKVIRPRIDVEFICSDAEAVALRPELACYRDKAECMRIMQANGIHVPKWLAGPAIVKPQIGTGSRGIKRVDGIVMEWLPGADWSVDFVAEFGEIWGMVPKRRIRERGLSIEAIVEPNETIMNITRHVAKQLRLTGMMNVQMKEDLHGFPRVYELNPRVGASAIFGVPAGVDLFRIEIARQLSLDPNVPVVPKTTRIVRRYVSEAACDSCTPGR